MSITLYVIGLLFVKYYEALSQVNKDHPLAYVG
jgi:hypothetical protein